MKGRLWSLEKTKQHTYSSFIEHKVVGTVLLWVISFTGNWYCNYESIRFIIQIINQAIWLKKHIVLFDLGYSVSGVIIFYLPPWVEYVDLIVCWISIKLCLLKLFIDDILVSYSQKLPKLWLKSILDVMKGFDHYVANYCQQTTSFTQWGHRSSDVIGNI